MQDRHAFVYLTAQGPSHTAMFDVEKLYFPETTMHWHPREPQGLEALRRPETVLPRRPKTLLLEAHDVPMASGAQTRRPLGPTEQPHVVVPEDGRTLVFDALRSHDRQALRP